MSQPRLPLLLTVLACLAGAPAAWANDTTAVLAAGGLVLTKSDSIEMRSEDLYISQQAVRVRYVFANTSGKDVTVRVAFPMPDIGGPDFFRGDVAIPVNAPANILGFKTKVDGKPVAAQVEQKAITADGVDRTAWLLANHIPLAVHVEGVDEALQALPKAKRDEAIKLGLYDPDEGGIWVLKTTYHWLQTFPAGRSIVVEHAYTPSVGSTVSTSVGTEYGAEQAAQYCVDKTLVDAVKRAGKPDKYGAPAFLDHWIDYVLVTGGNWKKPIGDFRLVVDKGSPRNLVSFCGSGVKKISPTQFEMRRTNWRPEKDLSILLLVARAPE